MHQLRIELKITKDCFYDDLEYVLDQVPKHHMKILLGDFNVGREDIFKPRIRNKILHEISNGNGVRVVNVQGKVVPVLN
jgi:hypothetical protein